MNDKIAENLGLRPLAEIREEELEQEERELMPAKNIVLVAPIQNVKDSEDFVTSHVTNEWRDLKKNGMANNLQSIIGL